MHSKTPRKIVHLDADAFFASVEQALNPELRTKPIAVGGRQRGIISSASYTARKRGVYTPMPTSQALKICPELIVIPGDHHRYQQFSRYMFQIIRDFTPDIEQCSIDEGYFELTARREPIQQTTQAVRSRIQSELGIPVSFGMGTSKLVTQIASKMYKPESFHLVPPGSEAMFLYPLSNRWLPGIGEKTGLALDRLGLFKVFHILESPLELLQQVVGNYAAQLKQFAKGIDDRPVISQLEPAKSYGKQHTFLTDIGSLDEVELRLKQMLDRLMPKLRADSRKTKTLTLKLRYSDMNEAQGSESLPSPTCLESDIYPLIRPLLERIWEKNLRIRMIGISLSNLYSIDSLTEELPLFANQSGSSQTRLRLATTIDLLHKTLGANSIRPARDILPPSRKMNGK